MSKDQTYDEPVVRRSNDLGMGDKEEASVYVEEAPPLHGEVQLERNFGFFSCLGLAFALLNSWTAMSASLQLILPSGGSVAMVWGLVVSAIGTLMMALSMAEICHVFPMSGGQYDWTYCIAPVRMRKSLSFFVGWMACAGWTTLLCAAASLGMQYVAGVIFLWKEDWEMQRWHVFLLLVAFVVVEYVINAFAVRSLPHIDRFAGVWGMAGIIIVPITLLACSSGEYQKPKVVFSTFINETGWPAGFAFILGLLQSVLCVTAFDAVTHMVEEMPQPARNAPRIMVLAVLMGSTTTWIFVVVLLFCMRDIDSVVLAPTGPLIQIYYQATNSKVGATCLVMFNLVSMTLCINAVGTVSSRMLLSFARDRGMGAVSRFFAPVHATLKSPVRALSFCGAWVIIFGCVYLGSTVALNAILSGAILFLQISYLTPIAIVFCRGDVVYAGHSRDWSLGKWRPYINAGALAFGSITSICFIFPPAIPITGESMNYAIVAFAVVILMATVTWFIDGRKNFDGPKDLDERLALCKNA